MRFLLGLICWGGGKNTDVVWILECDVLVVNDYIKVRFVVVMELDKKKKCDFFFGYLLFVFFFDI